jgi:hypothetical protein
LKQEAPGRVRRPRPEPLDFRPGSTSTEGEGVDEHVSPVLLDHIDRVDSWGQSVDADDLLGLAGRVDGLAVPAVEEDVDVSLGGVLLGDEKPYLNRSWNVRVEQVSRRGDLPRVRA